jgi:hypothetical protein
MAIIALEDIGVANLDLVADILAVIHAGKKSVAILDLLLERACRSFADRTADHLGSLIKSPLPPLADDRARPWSTLDEIFLEADRDWQTRLQALAPLAWGEESPAAQRRAMFWEVVPYLEAGGMDRALIAGLCCQVSRARDRLPLQFALGWVLWREASAEQGLHHNFPRCHLIGGQIPDYGFDPLHTRLGRRAVDLWLRSYMERVPFEPAQIAIALWNTESAACWCHLVWGLSEQIRRKAEQRDLELRQLPADRHSALRDWIAKEAGVLTSVREAVWKGHVSALRAPQRERGGLHV